MNVIAYTALHYGRDYLASAIRSVIDYVDEYHVLYAAEGSHGHRSHIPCPETRAELYAIAESASGGKLRWHDGAWPHEGAQRDSIHAYTPDADVILVLDADEIWPEETVKQALLIGLYQQARNYRVSMVHFWRSFYRAVLHDPAYPTRVILPKVRSGEGSINGQPIAHMGYAQRSEIVGYKQLTHGHRGEWRQDDWFNTVFMANVQTNCHPVGSIYWDAETVNPFHHGMPSWMSEHPYFNMDVIP